MSTRTQRLKAYEERQLAIRTPFGRQRRGSCWLRLPNGHKKAFKDTIHRGAAIEAASKHTFKHVGEMIEFIKLSPNGFTSFVQEET
jgi:hypothetical protein